MKCGKSKNQCGRTLLETLTVLAIMGLISVVFIISYRYAMERHRAHLVISRVSEMAVSAAAQIILQDDFSLEEFKAEGNTYPYIQGTYPVMLEKRYNGRRNYFGLSVSGLSKMVCNFIVRYHWKMPIETKVNDDGECVETENENTILFVFNSDLMMANTPTVPNDPNVSCPNISFNTCQSKGYICSCEESSASRCTRIIMKSCGERPEYHYVN